MLLWCISLTAAYKRFDTPCTLFASAFKPYHPLYRDSTATSLNSATVSAPSLTSSDDFTRAKSSKPKGFYPPLISHTLKKLQCYCSPPLSCSCKSSGTNQDCIHTSPKYFCGSWDQRFWVKASNKNRRMSIVHVLAGQSVKSGVFSAFGFCKFPRKWLRRGSSCMSLRCEGTSFLWNESWNLASMSGKPMNWLLAKHSAWLLFGLCTCSIALGTSTLLGPPALAEPLFKRPDEEDMDSCGSPAVTATAISHGKKVLTNYSVIGIPGDGRCLFRAVAHGAHVRKGNGVPSEMVQRESADVLRAKVVDELVERRAETEWFIEGDFDSYTKRMRQPHVWGGEPELLMASHVLRMPITVYMFEQRAKGLISIAEYGQEYTKENHVPIRVLYHGFGHYDALQLPIHEN